jgi:glycosyltransferase involved in cell wall biosynthesis
MKLWIDGQCFQTASRYRGIGRYVQELIAAMIRLRPDIDLHMSFNRALGDIDDTLLAALPPGLLRRNLHRWEAVVEGGEAMVGTTPLRRLSEIALAHHVGCLAPDVALSSSLFEGSDSPAVPLMPSLCTETACAAIFFDAIPFRFPERYLTRYLTRASYERRLGEHRSADLNLCISGFCRREALDLFPDVPAIDISGGVDIAHFAGKSKTHRRQPYLLYVGGLDWRKNVGVVVEAFRLMAPAERAALQVVIAGRNPPAQEQDLRAHWLQAGLDPAALDFLGHVSDADLGGLYRGAFCVVQPSRMEGFGLTAAEAMAAGAPVVAGRGGALVEVVGHDDLLFDPDRPEQLAAILSRLHRDPAFRAWAIEHGKRHVRRFTWEESAKRTIAALEDLKATSPKHGFGPDRERLRDWTERQVRALRVDPDIAIGILTRAETPDETK